MSFANELIVWYHKGHRELPWRENITPYRIWVSEIMLQQTRAETVKPYFERFMMTLPELKDLAYADEQMCFKLWEGLGYYRRIQNMQICAKQCVAQYEGKLPDTYEQLIKLRGIGSYTAAAIASIAFHEDVCAVDGNVLRVVARLFQMDDDITKESTKQKVKTQLETDILPSGKSADFNQAMMELGATVCLPNGMPKCLECPISSYCKSKLYQTQMDYPKKAKKKEKKIEYYTILIFQYKNKYLIRKRKSNQLLAGLYEFTTIPEYRDIREISQDYIKNEIIPLGETKHIFTHKIWMMKGYLVQLNKLPALNLGEVLVTKEEMLDSYTIPTAFQYFKNHIVYGKKDEISEK